MATISKQIEVIGRKEFQRENHHIPAKFGPIVQTFVAITMRCDDGSLLVNYTKVGTSFSVVAIGEKFKVSGQVKESRDDEFGPHIVITHCKRGGFKGESPEEASERRRKKMLKKLHGIG